MTIMSRSSDVAPAVIAHRGACGYRPEHTLAAFELAIEQGADYLEPDVVATKDGVLVVRHENEISCTTDVASRREFADRRATKTIGREPVTGWFTEDFTLAELKTLRVRERLSELRRANTRYDGRFDIVTLQEVVDLARRASARLGRAIGVYPETKNPAYFRAQGLALEERLVDVLHASGYRDADSKAVIQSFDADSLRRVALLTELPLVQLLNAWGQPCGYPPHAEDSVLPNLATPEGLHEIATYGQGVGPRLELIVPRDGAGRLLEPTAFVTAAHEAGLVVHAWTVRSENAFLPTALRQGTAADAGYAGRYGDVASYYEMLFDLGVDGVFSDQPDAALQARAACLAGTG